MNRISPEKQARCPHDRRTEETRFSAGGLWLFTMHYTFCRVHQTLRATPAMEAGIAGHVWTLEEVVGLLQKRSKTQHSSRK